MRSLIYGAVLALSSMLATSVVAADLATNLKVLQEVGPQGAGNAAAKTAWQAVAAAPATALPQILAALDATGPLGANYLRSAVDAIAEREIKAGKKLPAAALETFILDTKHEPRARRLAYEWLLKTEPAAREKLIPQMLNDPSVELRRDAVERLQVQAEALLKEKNTAAALPLLEKAMQGARDDDQVRALTKHLGDLGKPVDISQHFGFLMEWKAIGPFDNRNLKGYPIAYPPETELNFQAEYPGMEGPVRWKDIGTTDAYGLVDLNTQLAKHKGAVAYVYTDFTSAKEQPVELRLGCVTAWKLWVNGKLVFERDEYHRGIQLDQYRMSTVLKPGKNEILIKICQNEQTENWAQDWQYRLRVCDAAGTAILSTTRPPTPVAPKVEPPATR